MLVTKNTKFIEIQEFFQNYFSNLKLSFYVLSSSESQKGKISLDAKIESINNEFVNFEFEVFPNMKVSDFEQKYKSCLGVNVQVLRKSGNLWLETIASDDWTLNEQQEESLTMNSQIEMDEVTDYHEQE